MNQKKDLRKNKGQTEEKFSSPVPNRRRQEDNQNGLYLHDLSPFRPVYGTLNTAPNPVFFNTHDLAIIETPVAARTQPRPLLDQVEEGFRQISGVITWQPNNNYSAEEEYQSEQSEFLSSCEEEEHEGSLEKIPPMILLKPEKQNDKKIENKEEQKNQTAKKQTQKVEEKNSSSKRIFCNCKKTKCLKLYCDCFRENLTCTDACNCIGCHNLENYEEERNNAMLTLMDRNPLAFIPKIDVQQHSKGCHCKKSNCLKKYCQCFQAGIKCGSNCKCEECKNDSCHEKEEEKFQKNSRTTAKKQKKSAEVNSEN